MQDTRPIVRSPDEEQAADQNRVTQPRLIGTVTQQANRIENPPPECPEDVVEVEVRILPAEATVEALLPIEPHVLGAPAAAKFVNCADNMSGHNMQSCSDHYSCRWQILDGSLVKSVPVESAGEEGHAEDPEGGEGQQYAQADAEDGRDGGAHGVCTHANSGSCSMQVAPRPMAGRKTK